MYENTQEGQHVEMAKMRRAAPDPGTVECKRLALVDNTVQKQQCSLMLIHLHPHLYTTPLTANTGSGN